MVVGAVSLAPARARLGCLPCSHAERRLSRLRTPGSVLAPTNRGARRQRPPAALALLLAPFIFVPGIYILANHRAWSRLTRLLASLGYVAVSGVLGFASMSWFVQFMRQP